MLVSLSSAAVAAAWLWAQPAAAQGCQAVDTTQTWDYIVIGSGAAGIPIADKLSEAGKSVLLLEKGPPSTGRWGGTMKPKWLQNTQLTRFDVPGLCNEIWHNNTGVSCTDVDQMAGCVLGGGTAVNSGLWWKPHKDDWDTNFPEGWRSGDIKAAVDRVFARIPGTTVTSADGKTYLTQGYDMLESGLKKGGWKGVIPNDVPDEKNRTYGHATHMFRGGERDGPLATYLATASARANFKLQMYTSAKRIVRTGGHATGVEVECQGGQGRQGVYKLTANTGRVIVAAGALASPKVLFRSGIGPTDQLSIVQRSTEGSTMIASSSWINLPVGYNLLDHVGTDIEVAHPSVVFYDYYAAYENPIASDRDQYLKSRSGLLAQVAPNICMMFWEIITGADGVKRHLHWQSRVEGSKSTSMTITQYLGTGAKSRGRLTITTQLNTRVSTQPYLNNAEDKAAVIKGIENAKAFLDTIPNIQWIHPSPGQSVSAFVNSIQATSAKRGSNHWIGTAKLGTDSGLKDNGTSVVDLNTQVYGTDNIFVVDASIFPGHITGNPSAAIVSVAEHAAVKILALAPGSTN